MNQKKLKVFFNLRKSSRERMWDTAKYAAEVCDVLVPDISQHTSVARSASYSKKHIAWLRRLKRYIRGWLPLLNYQAVEGSDTADVIYMWGAFPRRTNKPFIIELDNPYVLTYYNQRAFKIRLRKIKKKLRQAKAITFMSKAARSHTLELIGKEFEVKCVVLPPYMNRNFNNHKPATDETVRFLFIGLGFRRKGGPELLEAFSQIESPHSSLTMVADVPTELKQKYRFDNRITFVSPQPREKLFSDIYPHHDILVFPSLHESLGVVVLEAMSFGLGIISTNVYATPEMVINNKNGVLLEHPFLSPVVFNSMPIVDCVTQSREKFVQQYLRDVGCYEKLVTDLRAAITESVVQYKVWQQGSHEYFDKQYAPDIWNKKLQGVISSTSS